MSVSLLKAPRHILAMSWGNSIYLKIEGLNSILRFALWILSVYFKYNFHVKPSHRWLSYHARVEWINTSKYRRVFCASTKTSEINFSKWITHDLFTLPFWSRQIFVTFHIDAVANVVSLKSATAAFSTVEKVMKRGENKHLWDRIYLIPLYWCWLWTEQGHCKL